MLTPMPICIVEPMMILICPLRIWSHRVWRVAGSGQSCTQATWSRGTPRSTIMSVRMRYTLGPPPGSGVPWSQNTACAAPGTVELG